MKGIALHMLSYGQQQVPRKHTIVTIPFVIFQRVYSINYFTELDIGYVNMGIYCILLNA